MEKKYRLTEETKKLCGITLYRIEALRDFGGVKKGDKGGWIEKEMNLSHGGDCWVYEDAKVFSNACVYGNALVSGKAALYGNSVARDKVQVRDNAEVCGNAVVSCNAIVFDGAEVYGNAVVYGYAKVSGNARVYGYAAVCEHAKVSGNAVVRGDAEVCGNAVIEDNSDYIVFKNFWTSGRYFTWTKSNNKWKVGCFYGTGEQLIEKAYADSERSGKEYERVVNYVRSILSDSDKAE